MFKNVFTFQKICDIINSQMKFERRILCGLF